MTLSEAVAEVLMFGEVREEPGFYPGTTVRVTVYSGDGLSVWVTEFETDKEGSNSLLHDTIRNNRHDELFREQEYGVTRLFHREDPEEVDRVIDTIARGGGLTDEAPKREPTNPVVQV